MHTTQDQNNSFKDDLIGFSMVKAERWHFIPKQWAVHSIKRALIHEDQLRNIVSSSNDPFLYIQYTHQNSHFIYPCLQARRCYQGHRVDVEALLSATFQILADNTQSFSLVNQSSHAIFNGHQAATYECTYQYQAREDLLMSCRSTTWIVPRNLDYIIITANRPVTGPYQMDEDFKQMYRSIKIRRYL